MADDLATVLLACRLPYMLVVGPRDAKAGTISLRDRLDGDLGAMPLVQALARLTAEITERRVRKTFSGEREPGGQGDGE
jgi:threonyl-tRNA synthetase